MSVAPCKNCQDRELGCHTKCYGYLAWLQWFRDVDKLRKEKARNSYGAFPEARKKCKHYKG